MITYICQEEQHNKFWQYNVEKTTIEIEYGRIGNNSPQHQTKNFSSLYEVQQFINRKVKEKERKGYVLIDKPKFKQEEKISKTLGTQHKIKRMLWMSMNKNTLIEINNYDPKQYVYVEIINSWSKKITRLILTKHDTYSIVGSIAEQNGSISYDHKIKLGHSGFALAIRQFLQDMAIIVIDVIKTTKFAAVGVRNLFDDKNNPSIQLCEITNITGFDKQIISKFAAMGNRVLEL